MTAPTGLPVGAVRPETVQTLLKIKNFAEKIEKTLDGEIVPIMYDGIRKEECKCRKSQQTSQGYLSVFVCQNIIQRTGILKYVVFRCRE